MLDRRDKPFSDLGAAKLRELAMDQGRSVESVEQEALRYLRELDTRHDRPMRHLAMKAGRALSGVGHTRIDCDPAEVARVRELFARYPVVVLSSHRSYLDAGVLNACFADSGLPELAEFIGMSTDFGPLGPLWRHFGGLFVRSGAAGAVYKAALHEHIGRLVEQRRPMRSFIEALRSRTGKLSPPELGLLAYVVDAYLEGRSDDVCLLPVSVSYDQLYEVAEFAEQARGSARRSASLRWLMNFLRAQRGRFGAVHLRFGEPISLRHVLGPPGGQPAADPAAEGLILNKLAFEVSWRINAVTPITGTALVAVALLGARRVPLTLRQMGVGLGALLAHARRLDMPMTPDAEVDDPDKLREVLATFEAQGVVETVQEDGRTRYRVTPPGRLQVAYYLNSLIHFFLPDAIAELALIAAAADGSGPAGVNVHALAIRDLLKFEFFFQDKEEFLASLGAALQRLDPGWQQAAGEGPAGVRRVLNRAPVLCSDMMLRSFFEAYFVVADEIIAADEEALQDPGELLEGCEERGMDYLRQHKLRRPESVSRYLFTTGLTLAHHRGLLDPPAGGGRAALAAELHEIIAHMGIVRRVAVRRVLEVAARPPQGAAGAKEGTA